ncbi:MAG: methylenetetrahydrofolate reductase [Steroidobacteraceae bacterium]
MTESRSEVAAVPSTSLQEQLVRFARRASIEITPDDAALLPQLAALLPAGTTVYVAHTPKLGLDDVVRFAIRVQQAGFRASAHIVARALESEVRLRDALTRLGEAGCDRILLVAGDYATPVGPFSSTIDVLESGATVSAGMTTVAVAGHPEGNPAIPDAALWSALEAKQAFAARTGTDVYVLTQFGFKPDAVIDWCSDLRQRGITLPVHAGLAGPTPLSKLIRYAMRCGIGASLRVLTAKSGGLMNLANMAKVTATPDEMLVGLVRGMRALPAGALAQPHFFSFGGCVETARWMVAVGEGAIAVNADESGFAVQA